MASSTDTVVQVGNSSSITGLTAANSLTTAALRTLIEGTDGPDIINGTSGDDKILAKAGDDIIFGTTGNDIIDGGDGFDTVDYSNVAAPITLFPKGSFSGGSDSGTLISIERIIGAAGQKNTIDSSATTGAAFIDVNLAANQLNVKNVSIPGSTTPIDLKFTVENFVDVFGTQNADSIIGDAANNVLTGGGGNDRISGGGGGDKLNGTDSIARGVGERDILTGGAGADQFILGDKSGAFYKGNGNGDFARITDFASADQIQLGSEETYSLQRNTTGFNLFATTGGIRDLIAQVQFGPIKSASGLSAMSVSADGLASDPLISAGIPADGTFSIASGQSLGIFTGA